MKKEQEFVVGQKYRGYGVLNAYGEFQFIPEETGKNAGKYEVLHEAEDFVIKRTKEKLLIYIRLPRVKEMAEMVKQYTQSLNKILQFIISHEI